MSNHLRNTMERNGEKRPPPRGGDLAIELTNFSGSRRILFYSHNKSRFRIYYKMMGKYLVLYDLGRSTLTRQVVEDTCKTNQ